MPEALYSDSCFGRDIQELSSQLIQARFGKAFKPHWIGRFPNQRRVPFELRKGDLHTGQIN